RVLSGGMQRMVRRRLSRVPLGAVPALRTAAVCGRVIDPVVLQAIHPEVDLSTWTAQCAAAAVLDVRDRSWWFSHDKLREQIIRDLPAETLRTLHHRIAETMESPVSGRSDAVMALAYHWREAGNTERAREHGQRALRLFGCPSPQGSTIVAIVREIGLRAAQLLVTPRSSDPARARRTIGPVARVLMRLIDTYFYSIEGAPLAWSILRMMNESEPGGPSPELARAYSLGSLLAGMASAKRLGEAAYRRAVDIAEAHGSDADRAWVLARVAVFRLSFAEWDPAAAAAGR